MIKYIDLISKRKKKESNLKSRNKNTKFRETPGLTHITQIDNYNIIYSPLAGRLYSLDKKEFIFFKELPNKSVERKDIKKFIESGLLIPCFSTFPINFFLKNKHRKEKKLALFLTNDCNLACKYCYGERDKISYLKFDLAKKVIDKFIEREKPKELSIDFHGGGEPTLALSLMKKIIKYVKAKKIKSNFNIQTNGIISKYTKYWLFKNMRSIAVSCDGPPSIQDKQRPIKNGQKSSFFVEKTIRFLVDNNYKNLFINAVISSFSVDRMEEIVKYFYNLGVKNIGFSLLSETRRSKKNKIYPPNLDEYIENALKIIKFADGHKIKIRLELLPMNEPKFSFCGLSNPQFCLTPDGYISSCYEVTSKNSEIQDFLYGRFNEKKNKLEFDNKRLKYLKRRRVGNIKKCQNCYLRLVCAGDCPARAYRYTGSIFKPSQERCKAIKEFTKKYLIYKARKELIP